MANHWNKETRRRYDEQVAKLAGHGDNKEDEDNE